MSQQTGRPTKLTEAITKKIADVIRAGNYIETAASYAGIDKTTLYDWMRRGARGDEDYVGFSHAIEKALAEAEMRDVMIIGKAAQDGHWQASAWRLERKFPKKWGRMERVEMQAEVTNHNEYSIIQSDAESVELLEQLWRRRQAVQGTCEE